MGKGKFFNDFSSNFSTKHKLGTQDTSIPAEYVFAFEDESSRNAAKAALSFTTPLQWDQGDQTQDDTEKPQPESFTFDYRPAFAYTNDTETERKYENLEGYRTIFTYSELPGTDPLRTTYENPVGVHSGWKQSGAAFILYLLSGSLLILLFPILCWVFIKWIPKHERLIVFRLGRRLKPKGPGLVLLLPFCDRFCSVRLDDQTVDIGSVSGGTEDEALIEIHCFLTYRLTDLDYVCATVKDTPKKLLIKEAQLSLLSALSHFRWSYLNSGDATRDLTSNVITSLGVRCSSYGMQVSDIEVRDLRLIRAPPSPDQLQQNRMSIIQKQLRALSSAFCQKSTFVNTSTCRPSIDNAVNKAHENEPIDISDSTDTSISKPLALASSSKVTSPCKEICTQAVARVRPLIKNELVGKALDCKRMQVVVSPSRPSIPLPTLTEASENGLNTLFCLDSRNGCADLGCFPGTEPPDVILYLSAGDLREVLRGRINLMDAVQKKTVFVEGDMMIFNKLRHLLHF